MNESATKALLLHRINALESAIRAHREGVRQDPCWEWDVALWAVLGDGDTAWPCVGESLCARLRGCITYLETHEVQHRKKPAKPRPCITETRRVFRDGTFRWDNKTYRAIGLDIVKPFTRYGIGVRDDGSVFLRDGRDFIADAVELKPEG